MIELDPLIAGINDCKSLNDWRVKQLLIDVLRDTGTSAGCAEILAHIRKIADNSNHPQSMTAEQVLSELNDFKLDKYHQYLEELANKNIQFRHLFDAEYPDSLWRLNDPPLALYIDGSSCINKENIAIVGTRDATDARKEDTFKIANALTKEGHPIVSGLARGVDSEAHRGAIESGGYTLAVLPGDIESVYPKSNSSLADEIRRSGALISEISKFESMHNGRYIERNRITSGISEAIVVTASGKTGGTVRQASIAERQGIPRFLYSPRDESGQSPDTIRNKGFVPFSEVSELLDFLNNRENHFSTVDTKPTSLGDF